MASKIKVDQIQTIDGTGTIALQNQLSGMTSASMPSGSVLQVVSMIWGGGTGGSSTSWFAAHSDYSLAITPSASSSKILAFYSFTGYNNVNGCVHATTLYRGSTNLSSETYGFAQHKTAGGGTEHFKQSVTYLDSPNTTNATTYKPYLKSSDGNTIGISGDSDHTIILMEIAG